MGTRDSFLDPWLACGCRGRGRRAGERSVGWLVGLVGWFKGGGARRAPAPAAARSGPSRGPRHAPRHALLRSAGRGTEPVCPPPRRGHRPATDSIISRRSRRDGPKKRNDFWTFRFPFFFARTHIEFNLRVHRCAGGPTQSSRTADLRVRRNFHVLARMRRGGRCPARAARGTPPPRRPPRVGASPPSASSPGRGTRRARSRSRAGSARSGIGAARAGRGGGARIGYGEEPRIRDFM